MGTITGQNILDRARDKANDETATYRWSDARALEYINDGQREVVLLLPRANTTRSTPTLAAGTRQTLAGLSLTTGLQVMDVVRNYDSTGATPGRAITKIKRQWLDERYPTWHTGTATEAKHWTADEDDPKAFYIWPAVTSGKAEVIYSAVPTDLATLASTITMDDIYANALQWFLLFSMYSRDATHNRGQQLSGSYYSLFLQSLGIREKQISTTSAKSDKNQAGV